MKPRKLYATVQGRQAHPDWRANKFKILPGKRVQVLGWDYEATGRPLFKGATPRVGIAFKRGKHTVHIDGFPLEFLAERKAIKSLIPQPKVMRAFLPTRWGKSWERAAFYPGYRFRFPCAFDTLGVKDARKFARWVLRVSK